MPFHRDNSETPELRPPAFKVRYPGSEAWDSEAVGSGEVLQVAADHMGAVNSADVLARHWCHSGRPNDILAMAQRMLEVHRRLTRP